MLKISVTESGYHILEIRQAGRQMIDTDTGNKASSFLQSLCYRVSELSSSYTRCTRAEMHGTANRIISMSAPAFLAETDLSLPH